jgi:thiosulfate reductase cytochrome b subunit
LLFLLSHIYLGTTGKTVGQMFKMMITGWHEH